MIYKSYTIEPSTSPFGGFDFFPTEQGRDDDYDLDGEDLKYCGNVKHASSIDEAKDMIDELIMMAIPPYKVETIIHLGGFRLRNITKFDWISDAVKFAARFNGEVLTPIVNP